MQRETTARRQVHGPKAAKAAAALCIALAVQLLSLASGALAHSDHVHEKISKKDKKGGDVSSVKVTVGVSVTKGFAGSGNAGAVGGSGNTDDHSGHQHLLLHEGENHGDSGGGSTTGAEGDTGGDGRTTAPAFDPTFTAKLDYGFTKILGLGLLLGYGYSGGLLDPEFGPTLKLPIGKKATFTSALTASYPASKAGRQNYKITSIKLVAGPNYEMGRFSLGFAATVAYAWYSKTIIVDEEPTTTTGLRLMSGEPTGGLGPHGGADDGDTGGAGVQGPSGDNLASVDREFSRYGGRANVGYKINKRWRNDSSVGAAMINHQFGASSYATDATLAQLSFSYSSFAAYVALAFYKGAASISAPTEPSASVGLNYIFR